MLVLMVMSSDPKCGCLKVAILVDGKSQFFTVLIFLDVTTLSKKLLQDNDHVDIIFQFRTVIFDLMQGI